LENKFAIRNPQSAIAKMPLLIFIILILAVVIWWSRGKTVLNYNERQYLKRRGYVADEIPQPVEPVDKSARLFTAIESLSDLSPYARQRAAQDLARMCDEGKRDSLMFFPLVDALNDSDAAVRSAAANALSKLEDERAIAALKQRLEIDDSIQVIPSLRKALEKLQQIEK
jgi:hypothetical protein